MKKDWIAAEDRARARVVMHLVSAALDVPMAQINGDTRGHTETAARAIAYYLLRVAYGASLGRVAAAFGRDRSTVRSACSRLEERRDDPRFDRWIAALEAAAAAAPLPMIDAESAA
jgi:chromosomal replication initiation ATPase DnaA